MYAGPVRLDRPLVAARAFEQGNQDTPVRPGNEDRYHRGIRNASRPGGDGSRAVHDRRHQALTTHGGHRLIAAGPRHGGAGYGLAVPVEDRGGELHRLSDRHQRGHIRIDHYAAHGLANRNGGVLRRVSRPGVDDCRTVTDRGYQALAADCGNVYIVTGPGDNGAGHGLSVLIEDRGGEPYRLADRHQRGQ